MENMLIDFRMAVAEYVPANWGITADIIYVPANWGITADII